MLGIISNPSEESVVREFFELFKTPWEFYSPGNQYDAVICSGDVPFDRLSGHVTLIYSSEWTTFDASNGIGFGRHDSGGTLRYESTAIPIYGGIARFPGARGSILTDELSRNPAGYELRAADRQTVRIGYDLFREVEQLLTDGQPAVHALSPTLDLHIQVLRQALIRSGVPIVEIPPIPAGHSFMVCLTHDLDNPSLRSHWFDATMFGFLYRSTFGSFIKVLRGRLPVTKLIANIFAALKLPFVYLGLARDFWKDFDRYIEIEQGKPSTFFVIPFEGKPGRSVQGAAPQARSAAYNSGDIGSELQRIESVGGEIGVHGIDAWADRDSGACELERISNVCGHQVRGVRMHWLYFDHQSPSALEDACFVYDSTVGYNQAVGYRSGTAQVFRFLESTRILELPLHIMDTALFYPSYLNLKDAEAWALLTPMFQHAEETGGALTINWHDRSIAPERLWGDFYERVLKELERRGAFFCTGSQAVAWFQRRRDIVFERSEDPVGTRMRTPRREDDPLPKMILRVHTPGKPGHFQDRTVSLETEVQYAI